MPKIRQEVNLLNGTLSGATSSELSWNGATSTALSGHLDFYFEIVASSTSSGTATLNASGYTMATITVNTASPTIYRVAFTTFPRAAFQVVAGAGVTIKAARVVILQSDDSPLFSTETMIEIGSRSSITSTSFPTGAAASNMTNPKYWKYVAANWNGSVQFFFEACLQNGQTKTIGQLQLQVADGTGNGFTGWSNVTNGNRTAGNTTPSLSFVNTAFTPIDGRNYRVVGLTAASKSPVLIWNAKIIARSTPTTILIQNTATTHILQTNTASAYFGQSFTGNGGQVNTAVLYQCCKLGAPTGSVVAKIYAHSGTFGTSSVPTGAPLAISNPVDIAQMNLFTGSHLSFYFPTPFTAANGTNYVITFEFTFTFQDASNAAKLCYNASSVIAGNYCYSGNGGSSWFPTATTDLTFALGFGPPTKIEAQYLLANTLIAGGTDLQGMQTQWLAADWSAAQLVCKHAADANTSTTTTVELETSPGAVQLAGSPLASPAYQTISGTVTMPGDGDIDVKATTNNGGIYASRLLVLVTLISTISFSSSLPVFAAAFETATIGMKLTPVDLAASLAAFTVSFMQRANKLLSGSISCTAAITPLRTAFGVLRGILRDWNMRKLR